jgi:hypothetical protein
LHDPAHPSGHGSSESEPAILQDPASGNQCSISVSVVQSSGFSATSVIQIVFAATFNHQNRLCDLNLVSRGCGIKKKRRHSMTIPAAIGVFFASITLNLRHFPVTTLSWLVAAARWRNKNPNGDKQIQKYAYGVKEGVCARGAPPVGGICFAKSDCDDRFHTRFIAPFPCMSACCMPVGFPGDSGVRRKCFLQSPFLRKGRGTFFQAPLFPEDVGHRPFTHAFRIPALFATFLRYGLHS